jgi:D-amino-acid dehydrogenase
VNELSAATSHEAPRDVVVIGAGIVGLCCAWYLQESGFQVTLVDKGEPGQRTSYGNAGVISPWSCVPQAMPGIWKSLPGYFLRPDAPARVGVKHAVRYLPWLLEFLRQSSPSQVKHNSDAMHQLCGDGAVLYKQLLSQAGHPELIEDCLQIHAFRDRSAANFDALGYLLRSQKGAQVQLIDAAELHELEPSLSNEFNAAVIAPGMARALNPGKIGEVLALHVKHRGGKIITGEVMQLRRDADGWAVSLQGQTLRSARVVVSAGAWSAKLLAPLGIKVPLAAERGYHLWFNNTDATVNNSVMDVDGHVIATSMDGRIRVAGIAEFADADSPPNNNSVKKMYRIAARMIPALADTPAIDWMGVRPSFPDSLPLLEEIPNHSGLFAAFGHSHYGLMMAPKSGQLIAQLVSGKKPNIDLSVYGSRRFS